MSHAGASQWFHCAHDIGGCHPHSSSAKFPSIKDLRRLLLGMEKH